MLFLYLTFSLIFGENSLEKYMKLKSNKAMLLTEINQIKKQNKDIRKQINTFKKDPNLVEELAREQGLTKDGEIIFKYKNEQ
ncbi:MAG: septum formation initiator family protein [Nitrospirae bacterium]|nr:septum formation initiator family protein [Nitrospirota bacterium]